MSRYLMEPIRGNEHFKGAVRNIKNGKERSKQQQKAKQGKMGSFQRRQQSGRTFF